MARWIDFQRRLRKREMPIYVERNMIKPTYRFLLGASLALLMGAAAAQTGDDPSSRLPANKPASQDAQIQPEAQPTDKMTGPSNPQNQPADQSSQSAQAK